MHQNIILIFQQEAYDYLFSNTEVFEYYNYLAKIYEQLENHKQNQVNYIERIVTKQELEDFVTQQQITIEELKNNVNLLLQLPNQTQMDAITFPRVPDYLLKVTQHFVLPIQFVTNDINNLPLFDSVILEDATVDKLKQVINQYCFYTKTLDTYKQSIVKGQNVEISPFLVSGDTFVEESCDMKFENYLNKEQIAILNSPFDYLFITNQDGTFFVTKLLHLYFEGSFYEYRNFEYNNKSILNNIMQCLLEDIESTHANKFQVKALVDRFIPTFHLQETFNSIINVYQNIALSG
jgi:hypothetical protein